MTTGKDHAAGDKRPSLGDLGLVYTKIGMVGFGGGYAVLSLIRSEVVERRGWLRPESFDHLLEMTAFAPGATTVNVLTAIAYRLVGLPGVLLGTLALLWPSFVLMLALAASTALLHTAWLVGALRGVEVAVIGLLATVVVTLGGDLPRAIPLYVLALLAFLLTLFGFSPLLAVLLSAALGAVDFLLRRTPLPAPGNGAADPWTRRRPGG
jgi:chromate transporter